MKNLYALILPLCLLATGACTTADEPPVDASVPIGFSTQVEAVTKTSPVITTDGTDGTTKLTNFWVTGLYGESGNYSYVFENTEVSDTDGDNVWDTATPGYWIPEQTYRFAAYSDGNQDLPTSDSNDNTSLGVNYDNGTFRINEYEAGNRDLVIAVITGQDADDFIQDFLAGNTRCVPLEFKHILSMLTFTFTNQTNKEIEVADIRFTVDNEADWRGDTWNSVDNPTERHLHAETPLTVAANNTGTSDAAFVIPQENGDVGVTFTVNIRENTTAGGNLVFSKRYTSNLATGTQTVIDEDGKSQEVTDEWYIGYRYNYTATIPANVMEGADVILTVFVKDWDKEDANVSWGGKDEDDDTGATTNP